MPTDIGKQVFLILVVGSLLLQIPLGEVVQAQVTPPGPPVYFFSVVPTSPPDFTPCPNPPLGLPFLFMLDPAIPSPPPLSLQCDTWAFTSTPFPAAVSYPPGSWSVLMKNIEVDLPSTITPFQYQVDVEIVNPDFSITPVTSLCKVVGAPTSPTCPISVAFPGLIPILFLLPATTTETIIPAGGSLRVTISAELVPPPVTIGGPAPIRLLTGFPVVVPETDPLFSFPGLVTPLGSIEDLIDSSMVGGKIIPIETTSLLVAGAQSFSWMIPIVLSVLGIGLFVVSRKSEKS